MGKKKVKTKSICSFTLPGLESCTLKESGNAEAPRSPSSDSGSSGFKMPAAVGRGDEASSPEQPSPDVRHSFNLSLVSECCSCWKKWWFTIHSMPSYLSIFLNVFNLTSSCLCYFISVIKTCIQFL